MSYDPFGECDKKCIQSAYVHVKTPRDFKHYLPSMNSWWEMGACCLYRGYYSEKFAHNFAGFIVTTRTVINIDFSTKKIKISVHNGCLIHDLRKEVASVQWQIVGDLVYTEEYEQVEVLTQAESAVDRARRIFGNLIGSNEQIRKCVTPVVSPAPSPRDITRKRKGKYVTSSTRKFPEKVSSRQKINALDGISNELQNTSISKGIPDKAPIEKYCDASVQTSLDSEEGHQQSQWFYCLLPCNAEKHSGNRKGGTFKKWTPTYIYGKIATQVIDSEPKNDETLFQKNLKQKSVSESKQSVETDISKPSQTPTPLSFSSDTNEQAHMMEHSPDSKWSQTQNSNSNFSESIDSPLSSGLPHWEFKRRNECNMSCSNSDDASISQCQQLRAVHNDSCETSATKHQKKGHPLTSTLPRTTLGSNEPYESLTKEKKLFSTVSPDGYTCNITYKKTSPKSRRKGNDSLLTPQLYATPVNRNSDIQEPLSLDQYSPRAHNVNKVRKDKHFTTVYAGNCSCNIRYRKPSPRTYNVEEEVEDDDDDDDDDDESGELVVNIHKAIRYPDTQKSLFLNKCTHRTQTEPIVSDECLSKEKKRSAVVNDSYTCNVLHKKTLSRTPHEQEDSLATHKRRSSDALRNGDTQEPLSVCDSETETDIETNLIKEISVKDNKRFTRVDRTRNDKNFTTVSAANCTCNIRYKKQLPSPYNEEDDDGHHESGEQIVNTHKAIRYPDTHKSLSLNKFSHRTQIEATDSQEYLRKEYKTPKAVAADGYTYNELHRKTPSRTTHKQDLVKSTHKLNTSKARRKDGTRESLSRYIPETLTGTNGAHEHLEDNHSRFSLAAADRCTYNGTYRRTSPRSSNKLQQAPATQKVKVFKAAQYDDGQETPTFQRRTSETEVEADSPHECLSLENKRVTTEAAGSCTCHVIYRKTSSRTSKKQSDVMSPQKLNTTNILPYRNNQEPLSLNQHFPATQISTNDDKECLQNRHNRFTAVATGSCACSMVYRKTSLRSSPEQKEAMDKQKLKSPKGIQYCDTQEPELLKKHLPEASVGAKYCRGRLINENKQKTFSAGSCACNIIHKKMSPRCSNKQEDLLVARKHNSSKSVRYSDTQDSLSLRKFKTDTHIGDKDDHKCLRNERSRFTTVAAGDCTCNVLYRKTSSYSSRKQEDSPAIEEFNQYTGTRRPLTGKEHKPSTHIGKDSPRERLTNKNKLSTVVAVGCCSCNVIYRKTSSRDSSKQRASQKVSLNKAIQCDDTQKPLKTETQIRIPHAHQYLRNDNKSVTMVAAGRCSCNVIYRKTSPRGSNKQEDTVSIHKLNTYKAIRYGDAVESISLNKLARGSKMEAEDDHEYVREYEPDSMVASGSCSCNKIYIDTSVANFNKQENTAEEQKLKTPKSTENDYNHEPLTLTKYHTETHMGTRDLPKYLLKGNKYVTTVATDSCSSNITNKKASQAGSNTHDLLEIERPNTSEVERYRDKQESLSLETYNPSSLLCTKESHGCLTQKNKSFTTVNARGYTCNILHNRTSPRTFNDQEDALAMQELDASKIIRYDDASHSFSLNKHLSRTHMVNMDSSDGLTKNDVCPTFLADSSCSCKIVYRKTPAKNSSTGKDLSVTHKINPPKFVLQGNIRSLSYNANNEESLKEQTKDSRIKSTQSISSVNSAIAEFDKCSLRSPVTNPDSTCTDKPKSKREKKTNKRSDSKLRSTRVIMSNLKSTSLENSSVTLSQFSSSTKDKRTIILRNKESNKIISFNDSGNEIQYEILTDLKPERTVCLSQNTSQEETSAKGSSVMNRLSRKYSNKGTNDLETLHNVRNKNKKNDATEWQESSTWPLLPASECPVSSDDNRRSIPVDVTRYDIKQNSLASSSQIFKEAHFECKNTLSRTRRVIAGIPPLTGLKSIVVKEDFSRETTISRCESTEDLAPRQFVEVMQYETSEDASSYSSGSRRKHDHQLMSPSTRRSIEKHKKRFSNKCKTIRSPEFTPHCRMAGSYARIGREPRFLAKLLANINSRKQKKRFFLPPRTRVSIVNHKRRMAESKGDYQYLLSLLSSKYSKLGWPERKLYRSARRVSSIRRISSPRLPPRIRKSMDDHIKRYSKLQERYKSIRGFLTTSSSRATSVFSRNASTVVRKTSQNLAPSVFKTSRLFPRTIKSIEDHKERLLKSRVLPELPQVPSVSDLSCKETFGCCRRNVSENRSSSSLGPHHSSRRSKLGKNDVH